VQVGMVERVRPLHDLGAPSKPIIAI